MLLRLLRRRILFSVSTDNIARSHSSMTGIRQPLEHSVKNGFRVKNASVRMKLSI